MTFIGARARKSPGRNNELGGQKRNLPDASINVRHTFSLSDIDAFSIEYPSAAAVISNRKTACLYVKMRVNQISPATGCSLRDSVLLKRILVSTWSVNMTRIAVLSLLLTMGVFSAIAVNGLQTGVSARTVQFKDEINDKNWQTHPRIIAIRRIVNSANAEVKRRAFTTEHRICEEAWFGRLRIARDSKGTVRWYQHYQEGEDSSREDNSYYDDAGHLRFVIMTTYAANGTREQHRAYFDESGSLIYHGRRLLKGPGSFGPTVEDLKELVHMDPKKAFAEEAQGCKEVKPSAKHRTRKS